MTLIRLIKVSSILIVWPRSYKHLCICTNVIYAKRVPAKVTEAESMPKAEGIHGAGENTVRTQTFADFSSF